MAVIDTRSIAIRTPAQYIETLAKVYTRDMVLSRKAFDAGMKLVTHTQDANGDPSSDYTNAPKKSLQLVCALLDRCVITPVHSRVDRLIQRAVARTYPLVPADLNQFPTGSGQLELIIQKIGFSGFQKVLQRALSMAPEEQARHVNVAAEKLREMNARAEVWYGEDGRPERELRLTYEEEEDYDGDDYDD